ncbi:MmgE/PrpD family protein [Candidimonas nitroreducens]|uniref:2-methylcitrate dehydratase n=1 Tax=Candidimonas nitroreducens TaxID=683354 RepID=A0A225MJM6_9BURK|nr:MmgE/PrpD family protein [Candidimonas nitroreducens]OWT59109.1 2-methylcitrate dehydratase [Candidimonas nitroreducens]
MADVVSRLAEFAVQPRANFPQAMEQASIAGLLDTLAVTIAGSADADFRLLAQSIDVSPVSCRSALYSGPDTALLLGFASHVLDYDDVSMLCVCHPSAPIISALLAFCTSALATQPITGTSFLNAYCVGTEVMVRTGQALGFRHYQLGFHPTSTLGALGAAAAVCAALALSPRQCAAALGIAASMSGGLKKNFGSPVKPLHVGLAAASGLRAAQMALAGLGASPGPFEEGGFIHAFSGGTTDRWPEQLALGKPFAIMEPGFEAKRYPCCYLLHKTIEAVLEIQSDAGLQAPTWRRAEVRLPAGSLEALIHPYPTTGLAGKFSAPYVVAAGLLDGSIGLSSFKDSAVLRSDVQDRLHDVTVLEVGTAGDAGDDIGCAPVDVEVFWPGGGSSARRITASPGSSQDPMTRIQQREKWIDCLRAGRPGLSRAEADRQFGLGLGFVAMADVRPWLRELLPVDQQQSQPQKEAFP